MVERQTLTSQKRLPERACGFESRSRHSLSQVTGERMARRGPLLSFYI
jgi:hypothetical protein